MIILSIALIIIIMFMFMRNNAYRKRIKKSDDAFNSAIAQYNALLMQNNLLCKMFEHNRKLLLDCEAKLYNKSTQSNKTIYDYFTIDELKRIRFIIHPDKTNGNTNELFIKIDEIIKYECN